MTDPSCSFCGAGTTEVGHLISGPGVYICDGCVRASYEILQSLESSGPAATAAVPMDDPIMATIAQVQQTALRGDREEAATAYGQLWAQVEHGRALHRVCVAHYMADLQDDPAEELLWDERALAAAAEVTREDAAAVAPLLASLHVNAAGALHRLGRDDEARQQLTAARRSEEALPDDGYGRLVRSRIEVLTTELSGQQTLL